MTEQDQYRLELRPLKRSDYEEVESIMEKIYGSMGGAWTREQFNSMIRRFPVGQICIEDKGKVVAVALSLVIDYGSYGDNHTYRQIVGDGMLKNHDPDGDYLYGIDVMVDPEYREMRLGKRLYDARKELCENLNLKGIIIGGRIPGYDKYAQEMTPREYILQVKNREILDPVLTFQLSNDFHYKKVVRNYWPADKKSRGFGVILEWNNIYYEDKKRLIPRVKTYARLGVVQWQMRLFESFEDFLQQVEFFVDAVASYNSDIIMFPELFNLPLIAQYDQENAAEAMRSLAEYTETVRDALLEMAVSYNINIISGSVPEYRDNMLYNVCFLLRRDGTWDKQYKLHITPDEYKYWGLQGGDDLKVFDTDVGKIGILICYDVEFPELPRYLAENGMNILFIPFWTDTKNAYLRIRRCSQARAIENECYVAIGGSVGNIPRVENMDIQYSQAAVFTPSDFAFPHDAIAAEATPNTEMALIADLDVNLIKELRHTGSVRNLLSRRQDLYRIEWLKETGRKA
ncbi:MAG: GNAT family N-acetyltransferase [Synergistales bacterium]|nr:GNAT family N-acetyltransferase [Synergistales bacterium]